MELERRNAYFCKSCRKVTITVDIDKGVTPMFIRCIYCKEQATSFMYNIPPSMRYFFDEGVSKILPADLEWYKPTGKEYHKLSKALKEHIDKGGLNYRKRTNAQVIMQQPY